MFGVLFIILSLIILLNSKLFAVSSVEIIGNTSVSSEDVILNAGLNSYRNIFQIDSDQIKSAILQDPRIAFVKIRRQLPGKLIIDVQERLPICLLSYLNNLLIIGNDGLVMGIQEEAEAVELPIVTGAKLKDVKYGEKITASDFHSALKVLKYSDDYLRQVISEIDVTRLKLQLDLPKYSRQVEVELGTTEELEKKIANLRAILLSPDFNGKLERIDLRLTDLPTVITSKSLPK
ncbi:MAG: cell division protein FtsQ/DivIB [Bacteroidota bacterium]